jgi:hypothetical protein
MGEAVIDMLLSMGLDVTGVTTTTRSKQHIIEQLATAIEQQQVTLLNDQTQYAELGAFTGSQTDAGYWKYGAPESQHDDTVMSLAWAYEAAVARGFLPTWI